MGRVRPRAYPLVLPRAMAAFVKEHFQRALRRFGLSAALLGLATALGRAGRIATQSSVDGFTWSAGSHQGLGWESITQA